jgi:hypothetical protein
MKSNIKIEQIFCVVHSQHEHIWVGGKYSVNHVSQIFLRSKYFHIDYEQFKSTIQFLNRYIQMPN